ncbi:putative disease resistance protein RGA4 [Cucumis melo var. makuwa]|uniref:Disease resistance protein RGA4 n=2 Tax=Cucumis melo TaxID=3656 RepID=A0A5D3DP95_CUCMM|nr:putative disease resistance protein RGA4 [Cucumis melo var. makuwa]TYK25463.1 putative disease resistance protein RGA4 [Cucumis melo var. makuwa]
MLSLKSILMDAEEKQEHSRHLRNWLKELQNVFFQIEGFIDELKEEVYKTEGIGKQVLAPFSFSICQRARTQKMEKLFDHLDAVVAKMYEFDLKERHTGAIKMETTDSFLTATEVSTSLMKPSWKVLYPSTSAPKSYQHERYREILNDFKESTLGFFHIVGEAGIGKSTLAKFIYNDPEVEEMFTSRLWVCVKEEFDTQRLMTEILNFSYSPATCDNLTETKSCPTVQVQQYLREKTFLLVFQDLSIKNLDNSSLFTSLLRMGKPGSKIIVTTQNEEIANAIKLPKVMVEVNKVEQQSEQNESQTALDAVTIETSNVNNAGESTQANPLDKLDQSITYQTIFKVKRLSEEDSLSLFKDYASIVEDDKEGIIETLEKCNGVPLAIKCLGSMLSLETSATKWMEDTDQQEEVNESSSTFSILKLCYNQMPSHLKPCFLYCSQLQTDSILSSNDVIQLWMANGLLHSRQENYLSLEDIGEIYFKELCSRCFLQDVEEYGLGYWFKMHPLIRKLARILIQEQTKDLICIKPVTKVTSIAFPVRDEVPSSSFLAEKCISKFQYLRLLHLGYTDLQEIPNTIETLKHLRYLDLQGNKKIKRLPNAICNLQYLQTLILASCFALQELPKDIWKLSKLRYLWVTSNNLHLHKNGVGTMNSLRFLAIGGCDKLQDLFEQPSCLVRLETLMIYNCKSLQLLPNEMGSLISLQNLVIWSCEQLTLKGLEKVDFSLQRFTIRELPKVNKLPEWLQRSTETLRVLEIIDCPIRVEEEGIKMYKAVESKIIQGAVDVTRNLVWRSPMVAKNVQKIGNYY